MNSVGISESPDLFRAVNERIVELMPTWQSAGLIWLICECADERCTKAMRMTRREYDAMLAHPGLFGVLPGHERHDQDEIVGRGDRYVLVRMPTTPVALAMGVH